VRPAEPLRRRAALLYAGPLLAFLIAAMLPLMRGTETLLLRDVLNSHFPMKWSQAEAMRHGWFPILDPYRAGGQPLAGNLNAAPFYPDNLLVFLGSTFWAVNAHFWLHLLLAPFAFYWLGRAWGLSRQGSWAAAVCWTVSGFFLSHLNFYNLIAGVSLAPALVAACLDFVRIPARRPWLAPGVALLWTLLLLGGDPQTAGLAGLLSLAAVALAWRDRPAGPGFSVLALLGAAVLCGTVIALPQIVELLRIFPYSLRGYAGYSKASITLSSWDPRQAAEWLIPFLFGRPDVLGNGYFWGDKFFTGVPPYYLSLYPGLLTLALVAAAGRPRRRPAAWAWGAIGCGVFLSLGRFNPAAAWLLVHAKSFRYPIKFWLPVAVGAALLCGLGFERLRAGEGWRTARRVLLLLAMGFAAFWIFLSFARGPAETWLGSFIPRPADFIANERLRWAGLSLISLGVLAALGLALRISRRSWTLGGALLLAIHAAAQLWLLRPLYPMDAVEPYLVPPPALAWVPADMLVVNPDYNYLFGPSSLRQGNFPEMHTRWLERRSFYELYPFTGPVWGRRYELNTSPEGLDTYLAGSGRGPARQEPGTVEDARRLGGGPAADQPSARSAAAARAPPHRHPQLRPRAADLRGDRPRSRGLPGPPGLPGAGHPGQLQAADRPRLRPRHRRRHLRQGPRAPDHRRRHRAHPPPGSRELRDRDRRRSRRRPPGRPAREPPLPGHDRRPPRRGPHRQRLPDRNRGPRRDPPGAPLRGPRAPAPVGRGGGGGVAAVAGAGVVG
jgi:hypothetical protein